MVIGTCISIITLNVNGLNAPTKRHRRAPLVAQWLRVRLPMQGTQVCAPVREDPTCRGAAGPSEPWPLSLRVRSLCSATGEATTVRGPRTAKKKKKMEMIY